MKPTLTSHQRQVLEEYVCYLQNTCFQYLAAARTRTEPPDDDLIELLTELTEGIIQTELETWNIDHRQYLPERFFDDWVPIVSGRYFWKELI